MVNVQHIDEDDGNDDWKELMGKDLMMKIVSSGDEKGDPVEPHEAFLVSFEGRLAPTRSIQDGDLFQRASSWLISVGDSDVLPAIEMGIRFMKVGETAFIWSHNKFALGRGTRNILDGKKANSKLPPNSNVMYKITVERKVIDTSRLNPYFTIQKALTKKKIANDVYQNEWCPPPKTKKDPDCEHSMQRAIRLYKRAANEMEALLNGTYFQHVEKDHPQKLECKQILLDCLNNIVAVQLRRNKYHDAKLSAIEVLKIDPNNVKGLLRSAKAAIMDPASTLEEARAATKAAESCIEPNGKQTLNEKELKRLKILLKERKSEYKEKTKEMFANKLASKPKLSPNEETKSSKVSSSDPVQDETIGRVSENGFWKNQIYWISLQVLIPLVLLLVIKYSHATGENVVGVE